MPRKNNGKQTRRRAAHPKDNNVSLLYPKQLKVNGSNIPARITTPRISKVVRLPVLLTNAAPSFVLQYANFANQDAFDYLGVSTPRYPRMRVDMIAVYLENFPTTTTVSQPVLSLTDALSTYTIIDNPNVGTSYAACKMLFSFAQRQTIEGTTSTNTVAIVGVQPAPSPGSNLNVIVDCWVEFS